MREPTVDLMTLGSIEIPHDFSSQDQRTSHRQVSGSVTVWIKYIEDMGWSGKPRSCQRTPAGAERGSMAFSKSSLFTQLSHITALVLLDVQNDREEHHTGSARTNRTGWSLQIHSHSHFSVVIHRLVRLAGPVHYPDPRNSQGHH